MLKRIRNCETVPTSRPPISSSLNHCKKGDTVMSMNDRLQKAVGCLNLQQHAGGVVVNIEWLGFHHFYKSLCDLHFFAKERGTILSGRIRKSNFWFEKAFCLGELNSKTCLKMLKICLRWIHTQCVFCHYKPKIFQQMKIYIYIHESTNLHRSFQVYLGEF